VYGVKGRQQQVAASRARDGALEQRVEGGHLGQARHLAPEAKV
jgi:hypothetical protein